jgi:hypothetical protein
MISSPPSRPAHVRTKASSPERFSARPQRGDGGHDIKPSFSCFKGLSNNLFLNEIALDRDDNHDIKLSYLENLTISIR